MPRQNNKGIARLAIVIFIFVFTTLGTLTVIAIRSQTAVTIDSREDVEEILAKKCPNQEELAAAEEFVQRTKIDDLLDNIEAKKNDPACSLLMRFTPRRVSECVSPYLVAADPALQTCRICYDTVNTETLQTIKQKTCEDYVINNVDECFNWDITSYKPEINCYNSVWKDIEPLPSDSGSPNPDIPVGFPDQYDFSDYQTEPSQPPLEPLEPPQPELAPLNP